MENIYSLVDAEKHFLERSGETTILFWWNGTRKECSTYPEVLEFFDSNNKPSEEVHPKSESISEDKQNSITLKKDSKGNYNWDIKLYFNDDEATTINRIKNIDTILKERYNKIE